MFTDGAFILSFSRTTLQPVMILQLAISLLLAIVLLRSWPWLRIKFATLGQNFIIKVLTAGPIPKHVAFVMDGNRRYARRNHKAVQQGHSDGFIALRRVSLPRIKFSHSNWSSFVQILEICLKLNIQCVSAYAFSIENFKRPEEEVAALMKLAEEKLLEICQHGWSFGFHHHPHLMLFLIYYYS